MVFRSFWEGFISGKHSEMDLWFALGRKKGCIRAVMAEGMGRHMLFVLQLHGGDADVEALNYHGCVQFPLCW